MGWRVKMRRGCGRGLAFPSSTESIGTTLHMTLDAGRQVPRAILSASAVASITVTGGSRATQNGGKENRPNPGIRLKLSLDYGKWRFGSSGPLLPDVKSRQRNLC
jgi:hypothetical protein